MSMNTVGNTGEGLVQTWAAAQQKLLAEWMATARRFGGTPTMELWQDTLETWQASVKATLDTQAQWTNQWTDTLANATGAPDELRTLARQGQEDLRQWT